MEYYIPTKTNDMKTTEVNDNIIGKRCKCIFTGLMVTGTIEDIKITQYTAEVKVRFDESHNWGGELYNSDWAHARLHDEFGSLHHLEIIDDKYHTIKVTFGTTLYDINKLVLSYHHEWGAVNLKEWVDSYETSRFTQIDDRTAIITSEINIENITEWFKRNLLIEKIESII